MLSSPCSLRLTISDWGHGLTFPKTISGGKRWPSIRKVRSHNSGRVMQSTTMVTVEESREGVEVMLLVYYNGVKTEQQ